MHTRMPNGELKSKGDFIGSTTSLELYLVRAVKTFVRNKSLTTGWSY